MRVKSQWDTREVLASAARTTNGGSAAFPAGGGETIALLVNCTAASGTSPTLTISVEWSHDGVTWCLADPSEPMTNITAAGQARARSFAVKGRFARVWYSIAGTTPSFTFSVQAAYIGD